MTIQNLDIVTSLPYDLKFDIFDKLSFNDLLTCKAACKHWQEAIDAYPRYNRLFDKKLKIYRQRQAKHRNGGIALGCISTLIGATASGTLLPAILIGSGEASFVYACTSSVEDYNVVSNFKQIGFGALSGLAAGLVTIAEPITVLFGKTVMAQIGNQTIAQLASHMAEKVLNGKKAVNKTLISSSIGSLASSAASYGLNNIFFVTDHFSDTLVREFFVGAGSSSVGKTAENLLKQKKWDNKIEETGLFGGVLGAIQGVGNYCK